MTEEPKWAAAKAMRELSPEDRNRLIWASPEKIIDGRVHIGWRDTPYTRGDKNTGFKACYEENPE